MEDIKLVLQPSRHQMSQFDRHYLECLKKIRPNGVRLLTIHRNVSVLHMKRFISTRMIVENGMEANYAERYKPENIEIYLRLGQGMNEMVKLDDNYSWMQVDKRFWNIGKPLDVHFFIPETVALSKKA